VVGARRLGFHQGPAVFFERAGRAPVPASPGVPVSPFARFVHERFEGCRGWVGGPSLAFIRGPASLPRRAGRGPGPSFPGVPVRPVAQVCFMPWRGWSGVGRGRAWPSVKGPASLASYSGAGPPVPALSRRHRRPVARLFHDGRRGGRSGRGPKAWPFIQGQGVCSLSGREGPGPASRAPSVGPPARLFP